MRNTAFVVVGVAFMIAQSNFFRLLRIWSSFVDSVAGRLEGWGLDAVVPAWKLLTSLIATPNLILPLLVFTGVHEYSIVRGAALAFVLGYALDLFSGAPIGLFTFISVGTFGLARLAGIRLGAQTVLTQLALAFVFALVQGVLVLVLLAIFGKQPYVPRALVPVLLPNAVSTALAAPLVFRIAQRIHQLTITVPQPGEGLAR